MADCGHKRCLPGHCYHEGFASLRREAAAYRVQAGMPEPGDEQLAAPVLKALFEVVGKVAGA